MEAASNNDFIHVLFGYGNGIELNTRYIVLAVIYCRYILAR